MKVSEIQTGHTTFTIGEIRYRVVECCEEPNTGLVVVEEDKHPMDWRFIMPAELVAGIITMLEPVTVCEHTVRGGNGRVTCGMTSQQHHDAMLRTAINLLDRKVVAASAERPDKKDCWFPHPQAKGFEWNPVLHKVRQTERVRVDNELIEVNGRMYKLMGTRIEVYSDRYGCAEARCSCGGKGGFVVEEDTEWICPECGNGLVVHGLDK